MLHRFLASLAPLALLAACAPSHARPLVDVSVVDWHRRLGADFFLRNLLDADPADIRAVARQLYHEWFPQIVIF